MFSGGDKTVLFRYSLQQRKNSRSLSPVGSLGKLSRSNSLLALNEALNEAGEAIKNMDESDMEGLNEITFNDTQVEALKFLSNVASKTSHQ